MDRNAFVKQLAKGFYPVLRAQGFKGSGTSLRRADGLFHHIVHIQGSTSARDCYVNLGAHLEFEAWNEQGQQFFGRFSGQRETESLERLIDEHGAPQAHPNFNLIAARIALHVGDRQRALRIATSALERVPAYATGLRFNIKEFIGALSRPS